MALKANVAANFAGQAWRGLLAFIFIPVYIRYLGVEAYGLIAVYAVLLAWIALFDMGLRPALNREMARFLGGERSAERVRDLLRSIELLAVGIAAAAAVTIWAASGWIATGWLNARGLPAETVAQAIAIMGGVAGLSFIETVYVGALSGLQRQVLQNVVTSTIVTLRNVGVIGVLAFVSPTIEAFFIWQMAVAALSVVLLHICVYRVLPAIGRFARFSVAALREVGRFAAGMVGITLMALLLTQVDKTLLSRLLPLEEFAHYALAATLAGALYLMVGPISNAFYPRFTQLVARGDQTALRETYHLGAQLVTVMLAPAAMMLILFGERIVAIWTGDDALAGEVAPILRVLAFGSLLHGFAFIPYLLQIAYGWTHLTLQVAAVAVIAVVPALLVVVPAYGAIGAAWVSFILYAYLFAATTFYTHKRLPMNGLKRLYAKDIAAPLVAAVASSNFMAVILYDIRSEVTLVISSYVVIIICTVCAAGAIRWGLVCIVRNSGIVMRWRYVVRSCRLPSNR